MIYTMNTVSEKYDWNCWPYVSVTKLYLKQIRAHRLTLRKDSKIGPETLSQKSFLPKVLRTFVSIPSHFSAVNNSQMVTKKPWKAMTKKKLPTLLMK